MDRRQNATPLDRGTLVAGQFRLEGVLAQGSASEIHLASSVGSTDRLAVKILDAPALAEPEEVERQIAYFMREAAVTAQLSHPNIIELVELGFDPEVGHFLVLEYLEGRTLEQAIREEGAFDEARALNIGTQILSALAVAHQQRVLHRDLKPSNIQVLGAVGEPEQIKLFDFGISLVFEELPWAKRLTQADTVVGTPAWMSPEQCLGRPLTERSDLYSAGALLYYMVTGRPPFEGDTMFQVFHAILSGESTPVGSVRKVLGLKPVSRDFEKAVNRALEREPGQRFMDALHFQGYLDRDSAKEDWQQVSVLPGSSRADHSGMGLIVLQLGGLSPGGRSQGFRSGAIQDVLSQAEATTVFTHGEERASVIVHPSSTPVATLSEASSVALTLYRDLAALQGGDQVSILVAAGNPVLGLFDDLAEGAPLLDHLHQVLDGMVGHSRSESTGEERGQKAGHEEWVCPEQGPGGVWVMPEWAALLRREYLLQREGGLHDPVRLLAEREPSGAGPAAERLVMSLVSLHPRGGLSQDDLSQALSLVLDPLELLDAISCLRADQRLQVDADGKLLVDPKWPKTLISSDLPPAEDALIHLLLFSHLVRRGGSSKTALAIQAGHLEAVHRPSAVPLWMEIAQRSRGRSRQQALLRAMRLSATSRSPYRLGAILSGLAELLSQSGLQRSSERWARLSAKAREKAAEGYRG